MSNVTNIISASSPAHQNKKPSLRAWVIATNLTFIISTVVLHLLISLNNNEGLGYIVFGTMGLALIVIFLALIGIGTVSFVSAIASIVLNAIYLPSYVKVSSSVVLIRTLLVLINIIVFFSFTYLLSILITS